MNLGKQEKIKNPDTILMNVIKETALQWDQYFEKNQYLKFLKQRQDNKSTFRRSNKIKWKRWEGQWRFSVLTSLAIN